METSPVINDDAIAEIATRYGITALNADDATHYKLCQVILMLEERLKVNVEGMPNRTLS